MQLVERHIISNNHIHYNECDRVCLLSKNLYNKANYIVRQEFIKTFKDKKEGLRDYAIYLSYFDIRKILISSDEYTSLPRKVSNQSLILLDKNWKSFFKAIKDYSKNPNKYNGRPNLPSYKNVINGRYITTYELGAISKKDLKKNLLGLSGTNIKIPTTKKDIQQCRIIPRHNHYVIEIIYNVVEKQIKENNNRYASIDLGLNNLATIGFNDKSIKPIIINGRPVKGINQYYNKERSKILSILEKINKKKISNKLNKLTNKRNNKIKDYLHKSSRYIINHLVSHDINTLVIGNNKQWKQEINIGSRNNQNFVSIPHNTLIQMLEYKAKLEGISIILNEESYTSKCSFLDLEDIKKQDNYKGKRIKRGLFKASNGRLINADLNGSYNILRKAVPNAFSNGIEGVSVHPSVITITLN